ncbi:hypothetical protein LOK49_LG10G00799 [Camellia lanceoleosa]|uniref:Uncharacterized protein n=1 Tax=Camellia lanceoleosa TaxID=1840588 RepID=A0ACC0GAZ8_9ERIC|nr:hypothetical protein LOK49_LG10G00799 [Camellia lanceoleosa]
MGRRRRGGGSPPSTDFERVLRHHIESCNRHKYATVDEIVIVSHLRSNFPGYSRQKLQPFTTTVQKTLEHIKSTSITSSNQGRPSTSNFVFDDEEEEEEEEEEEDYEDESARKKVKRIDASEKRLQRLENQHIRRKRIGIIDQSSSSSESESESADGAVSTSEDAIYGEKLEPEFDLMKSMLRASYSESKDAEKLKENVEVELVVNNKADDKVDLLEGDMKRFEKGLNGDGDGGGGEEVKEKDGPRFRDLGGMSGVVEELKMEVIVPLYHPQLPRWLGVRPTAGILLHGPPGCGKTKLAHTELVSGVSGASEENIRDLFMKADRTAPSIVFIDEIAAIASKRENLQREMERRIVTQLMTCLDESHRLVQPADANTNAESSDCRPGYVLVIGATNRPDAVDPALRRPGRFDREIVLGVPDENARVEIIFALTRNLRLEVAFDLVKIARSTPGFVGADLAALANKAGNLAMKRIIDRRKSDLSGEPTDVDHTEDWWRHPWLPEEMENLSITMADFEEAAKMVQPSSRREGFSAIPNVKWEDVRGLHLLRKEFDRYIVRRIKYPEDYEGFRVDLETGFLLYGPPGCGKTLIAKAVANESGANFIHIKGPELLNKYVGESELAVRTIFSQARTCAPCILFFDEVDALTTKRGKEGGWVVEQLLNQMNEAAMAALEEKLTAQSSSDADHPISLTIKKTHFEQALKKISPSVSDKQKHYYHRLSESFRAA